MLVLNRKKGEKLKIGENITITVQQIKGNRVKLGVLAPKDIRVTRSEWKGKGAA